MANFDAGNFHFNFGNLGGVNRFQKAQSPAPKPEQEAAPSQLPSDGVDLSKLPMLQVNPEILPADPVLESMPQMEALGVARPENTTFQAAPLGLIDLNTIGSLGQGVLGGIGQGVTAANGLNSTSFATVSGRTIASATPLSPLSPSRMPTTSVAANGLEDTSWVTSSGRVISSEARPATRMPTTSVTTFGLQDSQWTTTSGRVVSLS